MLERLRIDFCNHVFNTFELTHKYSVNERMSFFNLTALGPQNIFQQSQTFLHLLNPEDLESSFKKISRNDGENTKIDRQISEDQVFELLTDLYRGPIPPDDLESWKKELTIESPRSDGGHDASFTLDDLITALIRAQSKHKPGENGNTDVSCASWTEYHDAASRHVRKPKGPQELFPEGPLTSGQDYGWTTNTVVTPSENFARKSCPETNYASHLIKSGIV